MNSPDSSAMTDSWAGPPQAGQAEPAQSSRPRVGTAARAASRTGPAATRTQKPRTGSGPDGSSSHASTRAWRASAPASVRAAPAARSGSGRAVPVATRAWGGSAPLDPPGAPPRATSVPVTASTARGNSAATGVMAAARSRRGNRPVALRSSWPAAAASAAVTTAGPAARPAWKRRTAARRAAKSPGPPRRAPDPNVTGRCRRCGGPPPGTSGGGARRPRPGSPGRWSWPTTSLGTSPSTCRRG